jgi:Helicase HerA, central domain
VAVSNAIDSVKAIADVTMQEDHGAGVARFIEKWLDDSNGTFFQIKRHDLYLGDRADGERVLLGSARGATLIGGASGAGKSRLTTLLVERLVEAAYQVCIVDPEGDYEELDHFTHVGDTLRTAPPAEVLGLLDSPQANVVVNLLALEVADRAAYLNQLMGLITGLRSSVGRPHWLIIDEAHHVSSREQPSAVFPSDLPAVFITTYPENLSSEALAAVQSIIVVGDRANEVLASCVKAVGGTVHVEASPLRDGQVLYWERSAGVVDVVSVGRAKQQLMRHTRKYAEGRLGEDISFYFRGPENALKLRAYNLATFMEIAQGIDDATWMFHLSRGDYSRWFRETIKDPELAAEIEPVQSTKDAGGSREAIFQAFKRRYVVLKEDP